MIDYLQILAIDVIGYLKITILLSDRRTFILECSIPKWLCCLVKKRVLSY